MSYQLRPATSRDVPALTALAAAQAAARHALDARLPTCPYAIPFLSDTRKLEEVVARQRDHSSLVAVEKSIVLGAINLCKAIQSDEHTFASYYPRGFTSIGLLAAQAGASPTVLMDLLAGAHRQATQWQTPMLVIQTASLDHLAHVALRAFEFRPYYHYALRESALTNAAAEGDAAPTAPPLASVLLEKIVSPFRRTYALDHDEPLVATTQPFVRHATKRDLDAIIALGMQSLHYHATCEPTIQLSRHEPRKMRARFEQALTSGKHSAILVAEWQEQVVGFYSLYIQTIDETWSPQLFTTGRYGLIAEVAVDEKFRGRGIGLQLFAAADAWFRAHQTPRIWLIYLARNPLSSRFWTALGFETAWDVMVREA
jgi:ribosomal protein S18 acetylase RimI-like enzyme